MEMVQKQWLQLKMKLLLGYNMKTVVLCVCVCVWGGEGGGRNLMGAFFLVEEDYPRLVLMMEF